MPGILSKILNDEWSLGYNCYEIGHVWTPSCLHACATVSSIGFTEALKLYAPLYLLSQVVISRRYDAKAFLETSVSILRSSTFITTHAFATCLIFCGSGRVLPRFYYRLHAFVPVFIGAALAILVEKPSRRGQLAIYTANIASECLFRIYADRGTIRPIPNGIIYMFVGTMSVLLYMIKKQGYGKDPVSIALSLVLGRHEAKRRVSKRKALTNGSDENSSKTDQVESRQHQFLKHSSCLHPDSCPEYVVQGFLLPFVTTWLGHCGLKSLFKIKLILRQPSYLRTVLSDSKSLRFGLFFGCFGAIYKTVNCALRRVSDGPRDWHGAVGGLLAGPAALFSPSTTITLYLFWKAVETLYCKGVSEGHFKNPNLTAILVYAFSVSQLGYCVLFEPKHMRPSYMKFADQISGHWFHMINRLGLSMIAPDAVAGYEEYFPNLHPEFCSNKFKETILVWLMESKFT